MKYDLENLYLQGIEWNKNSNKEILQYAIGALLYTPATNKSIVDKTIQNLKSIALCLEDAIMENLEYAEEVLSNSISKIYNNLSQNKISINELPLIFIRIRNVEQLKRIFNKLNSFKEVLTGFIIPKFNSKNAKEYLNEFEIILNKTNNIYIMPIIESDNIIHIETRIDELIKIQNILKPISNYVLNIRVGGNDFCNYYGFRRNISQTIYDINVVSNVLTDIINVFGRDYIVSAPVWEYFEDSKIKTNWAEGLKRELTLDKLNGFIGKTCIHPSQLKAIQNSLIVNYNDYQDAKNILGWKDDILGVQKGSNGRMNEVKAHKNWAEKTINLAKIYGVENL